MNQIDPRPYHQHRKRYEILAEEIARQIASDVLRPGDRLPSIRQTCQGRRLSPATVFQAYYLLESRGLIRAAPRSGYFVLPRSTMQAAEPVTSTPREGAHDVDISGLVHRIMSAARSRQVVPLGSVFPSPLLLPLDAMRRALTTGMRRYDIWTTIEDLPPGNEALRRQIAKRYVKQGVDVASEEIVLTNGAIEALNLCVEAFVSAAAKLPKSAD